MSSLLVDESMTLQNRRDAHYHLGAVLADSNKLSDLLEMLCAVPCLLLFRVIPGNMEALVHIEHSAVIFDALD